MDMHLLTSVLLFTPLVIFSLVALPWAAWSLVVLGYEAITGWAIMAVGMLCAALGISGIGYTTYYSVKDTQKVSVIQKVPSTDRLYNTTQPKSSS